LQVSVDGTRDTFAQLVVALDLDVREPVLARLRHWQFTGTSCGQIPE
jgi:hypothetical protein